MNLEKIVNRIMNSLDFNKLEMRENNAGCDFKGTLEHYREVVKEKINEGVGVDDIISKVQELIDNDYSCEN